MKIKIHATPFKRDGRSYLQILSPVRVANPVSGGEMFADLTALWDTGATISKGVTTITPDGSGGVNFCFEMKE